MNKITIALALLCTFLAGALARDLLVPRALAASSDPVTHGDIDRVVRALETIGREVRDAGKSCRK